MTTALTILVYCIAGVIALPLLIFALTVIGALLMVGIVLLLGIIVAIVESFKK